MIRFSGDMRAAVWLLNDAIKEMMDQPPRQTPENDAIFEKHLLYIEKYFMLTVAETYLVGKESNYPANWITWRTIANGRYRKAFEKLRENTMKRDDIKNLVRQVIEEEVGGDESVKRHQQLAQLAKKYDDIDKKARGLNMLTPERAALEDERMKVWWQMRKLLQASGLQEDHVSGYGHNVTVPQDANTMDKPTIMEYGDANTRARAIDAADFERAAALLYKWAEGSQIEFKEFRFLLQHFIQKSK